MGLISVEGEEHQVPLDLSNCYSIVTLLTPSRHKPDLEASACPTLRPHAAFVGFLLPLWGLNSKFPDPDNPGNSVKAEAAAELGLYFPVTGRSLTPQVPLFSLTAGT